MNITSTTVVEGHRVASGKNRDPRFPEGTLRMQLPHFEKRGLDLSDYHLATLNLSLSPFSFEIIIPPYSFRKVSWHPTEPPEDFSFLECSIRTPGLDEEVQGLIYYPHPETKPEHFQAPDVIEVIARKQIADVSYGSELLLTTSPEQIRIFR